MKLTDEEILNLKTALKVDDWLLERNFKKLECAFVPMQVDIKILWEVIQKNPKMSEEEFLEIAEILKGEDE